MIADGPGSVSEKLGRQFVEAALRQHLVELVFFYHRGVNVMGDGLLAQRWVALVADGPSRLVACSAATERRLSSPSAPAGWEVTGLASWWDAVLTADRVIRFGPGLCSASVPAMGSAQ